MSRFFLPGLPEQGTVQLDGPEAHHLAHVLRLTAGQVVELFNGQGRSATALISHVHKKAVQLELQSVRQCVRSGPQLTLAVAVPKGDRFDWLVEKAVELGVARLVPLITSRSVVDPRDSKLDRLRQTVVAACKQSRQDFLMDLAAPLSWRDYVAQISANERHWIAHPGGPPLRAMLADGGAGAITVAIGPEGGFSDDEVAAAVAAGAAPVALGELILRVETAALAVAALIRLGTVQSGQPSDVSRAG